ncbi:MAG TPA: serine hydrolase, partial [Candidatus Paceibacterota bacterium]
SAQEKDVGVYYLNPTTGQWAGVNENESFSPASMLKVPIMTAILRTAEKQPVFLSTPVYYDGSFDDNALETIKPQDPVVAGHSYTVEQLLEKMIKYSDNNATHLLYALLPQNQFDSIFTDLGLAAPTVNGPVDFMSPKTFTMFLRILYGSTYLTRDDSEKALSLMAYPDFPSGLQAGVPQGTVVAQKFGEREADTQSSELHDCGMIYYGGGNAYMLCVMTRGTDKAALASEIAGISKLVWEHVAQ